MKTKWTTLIHLDYDCEIWANCTAELQTDGSKMRILYDYAHWRNNNASLDMAEVFYDIETGRKILKALRCARYIWEHTNKICYPPLEIMRGGLVSNWSNAPASL